MIVLSNSIKARCSSLIFSNAAPKSETRCENRDVEGGTSGVEVIKAECDKRVDDGGGGGGVA